MVCHLDIFEKFPDGSTIWRACVFGQIEAERKLQELREHSKNKFVAIDIQAGETLTVGVLQNPRRGIKKSKNEQTWLPNSLALSANRELFIGQNAEAFWSESFCILWGSGLTDVNIVTIAFALD